MGMSDTNEGTTWLAPLVRSASQPRRLVCALVALAIALSNASAVALLISNDTARSQLGPYRLMMALVTLPYLLGGSISLDMTSHSPRKREAGIAGAAMMVVTAVLVSMHRISLIESWSGCMQGITVLFELAFEWLVGLFGAPIAYWSTILCRRLRKSDA